MENKIEKQDYVVNLLACRKLLNETEFGELIQEKKFTEARLRLRMAIVNLNDAITNITKLEFNYMEKEDKYKHED